MTDTELITAATTAPLFAHCPYSKFRAGAAVLAKGKVFCGCNVENSSLGLTICAERVAILAAAKFTAASPSRARAHCARLRGQQPSRHPGLVEPDLWTTRRSGNDGPAGHRMDTEQRKPDRGELGNRFPAASLGAVSGSRTVDRPFGDRADNSHPAARRDDLREYAESVEVRRTNDVFGATARFDNEQARWILSTLAEPWVLKDPRFHFTLTRWLPVLAEYQPALIWIRKDLTVVVESYRRRGEDASRVQDKFRLCQLQFERWPWGKVAIDAEGVAGAVGIFDPVRTRVSNGARAC